MVLTKTEYPDAVNARYKFPPLYEFLVQHKTPSISKQNLKLFLKLRYDVVISMLFKLASKNGGHRAHFKASVPRSVTYLCRKPGRIEKKKNGHFACVPALIMRKILRS